MTLKSLVLFCVGMTACLQVSAARVVSATPMSASSTDVTSFRVEVGPGASSGNVYALYGTKVPGASEMWEKVDFVGEVAAAGGSLTFAPSGEWSVIRFAVGEFYAKDGMIAYWDGICNLRSGHQGKVAAVRPWENLVEAQYDFSLGAGKSDWTLVQDKGIYFKNNVGYATLSAADTTNTFGVVGSGGTMEVSLGADAAYARNSVTILRSSKSSNVALAYDYRGMIFTGDDPSFQMAKGQNGSAIPDVSTVAVSYETKVPSAAFVNGASVALNGDMNGRAPSDVGEEVTVVGRLNTNGATDDANGFFYGTVHAIRLYDRALTPDEVVRNAAADAARFGSADGLTVMKEGAAESLSSVYGKRIEHAVSVVGNAFRPGSAKRSYQSYSITVGAGSNPAELWAYYGQVAPAADGFDGWDHAVKIGDVPPEGDAFEFSAPEDEEWRSGGYAIRFAVRENYVTEGLAARYDGIVNTRSGHADTLTAWENLEAEANDFKIVGTVGVTANALSFSGAAGCYAYLNSSEMNDVFKLANNDDAIEIDMAFQMKHGALDSATQVLLQGSASKRLAIASLVGEAGMVTAGGLGSAQPAVAAVRSSLYALSTFAVKFVRLGGANYCGDAYFNGELSERAGTATSITGGSSYGSDDAVTIGNRKYGSTLADQIPFCGEVHALRVYHRELTADELKRNAVIDSIRFCGSDGLQTAADTVVGLSATLCADKDPAGFELIIR